MEQGEGPKRRLLPASTLVLLVEGALGLVVWTVLGVTQESRPPAIGILTLPCLAVGGTLLAVAVSAVFVLPSVRLADALARRFGGRARWWVPLVASVLTLVVVAAPVSLSGGSSLLTTTACWLTAAAALTAPALLCRLGCGRPLRRLALWGTGTVLATAALGATALLTGVLHEYRPPTLTPAALAGTWTDGKGGTVTLERDGTARAFGVGPDARDEEKCTAQGTWALREGTSRWTQTVDIKAGTCAGHTWNVGGTTARPALYQYVGDPDEDEVYELRKTSGATE
ncbi:hypothetical protein ABR738_13885 [Streptomyces sp. Edi4]|uniref:hypothetical protein n=1 Tax=Streptomyces sp. Edi4 TaxID=3162527 RepID=UPI003306235C